MSGGPSPQSPGPRHLAGGRAPAHRPAPLHRAPVVDLALEPDGLEVAPSARVHRSRLGLAVAITLAALPVLVLDNLPATADTTAEQAQVVATEALDQLPRSEPPARTRRVISTPVEAPATLGEESTPSTEAPATTDAEAEAEAADDDDAGTGTDAEPLQSVRSAPEPAEPAERAPAPRAAPPAPPPTAPPTTAAPPAADPSSSSGPADPSDPATWDRLAACESGGNWSASSGNGYYGGLQFSLATWQNVGGTGYPHQATRAEQIHRGQILQARAGWGQWPHCSRELGYR